MSSPALGPLLLSVLFLTLLIVGIELFSKSKSSVRAWFNVLSALYLLILLIGNSFASIVVLVPYVDDVRKGEFSIGYALAASFIGVFAFKGILSNTNITIFNRGVLTIEEWIGKARDNAVAASIKIDVDRNTSAQMRNAARLRALPPRDLNAHVANALGPNAATELGNAATAANADPHFLKALALAQKAPDYVKSVLV